MKIHVTHTALRGEDPGVIDVVVKRMMGGWKVLGKRIRVEGEGVGEFSKFRFDLIEGRDIKDIAGRTRWRRTRER